MTKQKAENINKDFNPDKSKKYPAEIMDIINYYLSGKISSGRLSEFFDGWVDVNPIKSAYEALINQNKG
jgi:hypothetical protein